MRPDSMVDALGLVPLHHDEKRKLRGQSYQARREFEQSSCDTKPRNPKICVLPSMIFAFIHDSSHSTRHSAHHRSMMARPNLDVTTPDTALNMQASVNSPTALDRR